MSRKPGNEKMEKSEAESIVLQGGIEPPRGTPGEDGFDLVFCLVWLCIPPRRCIPCMTLSMISPAPLVFPGWVAKSRTPQHHRLPGATSFGFLEACCSFSHFLCVNLRVDVGEGLRLFLERQTEPLDGGRFVGERNIDESCCGIPGSIFLRSYSAT